PAPSTVEQIPGGFKVLDTSGQSLAYVYGRDTKADADIANVLTMDEANRQQHRQASISSKAAVSMLITRYAKIMMSLVLAAFCLLFTFANVSDYGTNYLFVQHVMSSDTTFPGNALMYRSITHPMVWRTAYAAIIAAEGITGLLFLVGAFRLFQLRNAPAA